MSAHIVGSANVRCVLPWQATVGESPVWHPAEQSLYRVSNAGSFPDGMAVDSDGFVWGGEVGLGQIRRYDPAGQLDRAVQSLFRTPRTVPSAAPI